MILSRLSLSVEIKGKSISTEASVELTDSYKKSLRIVIEIQSHALLSLKEVLLTLPDGSTVNCICGEKNYSSTQDLTKVFLIPLRSPFYLGNQHQSLTRLCAVIFNFPDNDFLDIKQRKLVLANDDWECVMTPTSERTVQFPVALQSELFQATHLLEMNCGGKEFSGAEAIKQLTIVQRFLSFCQGHQVGVGYATGTDERGLKQFEEFGLGRVDLYRTSDCWFDRHHASQLPGLYRLFVNKLADPLWSDTFHVAMYWTTRGDTNITGPDGSTILIQAALERLAWDVLTQGTVAVMSKSGFKKLNTAGRLRRLLQEMGIPSAIPDGLHELRNSAAEARWSDGPEAFAAIRNDLTHPERLLFEVRKVPYYQCYVLGKWYLELVLLRLLNYQGEYANRTLQERWLGQVEPVPWA